MSDDIAAEFRGLKAKLKKLEREYNPDGENLHFVRLLQADAHLFAELLELADKGLQKVQQHRNFFLRHRLYNDGMYWYDLFLMVTAAGAAIQRNKAQNTIPINTIIGLAERLVQITEYVVEAPLGGDITLRNGDALYMTLEAFPFDDVWLAAKETARQVGGSVQQIVEDTVDELLRGRAMSNQINVITPYWSSSTWVYDDPRHDRQQEPFVMGVPVMIDSLVKDIPNARQGFRLLFSASPFPGYQRKLEWVREDTEGNWYRADEPPIEGWLCPALFDHFNEAPHEIYVRAEPLVA